MTKEGSRKARDYFQKALGIDPNFEPAVRDLAITYATELDAGTAENIEEYKANFKKYAERALSLESGDPTANLNMAFVNLYYSDFAAAAPFFERGLELGPNDVDVLILSAGNLAFVGQPDKGPILAERAIRLNPFFPYWWQYMLRWAYFFDRQFDKAYGAATKITTDAPNDLGYLAMIAGQLGKVDEAKAAVEKVRAADPDWSVELYVDRVGGFAREVETDLLIESARKAGLQACMTAKQTLKFPTSKRLAPCEAERRVAAAG